ncbi:DUF418 domain-containing protein [Dokdonella sp.]|uniref:DUF418 domain-containing protein n=1 Tax=Dokdonella sp. TaxID=2291710 RepID=UPI00256A16CC|nr:DUF418 domain-containing protein [Dokdonella sp.]MBX3690441.1 DUF418 domain-containing protein [Dokdonella sp.]MDL1870244.1 DUF418 domain-containing protein [Gammaproteobacteria bacterium PRO6]
MISTRHSSAANLPGSDLLCGAQPVSGAERIVVIDIIRGFALFGVLWMNLFENLGLNMPMDALDNLPTAQWDRHVGFVSYWLMQGKAQTLFSLLFGFGFANIIARLEARGLSQRRIFLRRMAVLMLFGLINVFCLYIGDILNAYAAMGFLLYFTRRWPTRRLLLVALPLSLLGGPLLTLIKETVWGGTGPWVAAFDEGAVIRQQLFVQADYPAYVAELWRSFWYEWVGTGPWLVYMGQIMGRFLLGSWLFRQGWFADVAAHRDLFVRVMRGALPPGLLLSAIISANLYYDIGPDWTEGVLRPVAMLLLACGYAAAIVLLHLAGRCTLLFRGLAAVGKMALTNYLMQSVFYLFVVYGFGLGLMPWLGATLSLALALVFFAIQIGFSLWWMARHRFGPLEWLWRGLTYGSWPRLLPSSTP